MPLNYVNKINFFKIFFFFSRLAKYPASKKKKKKKKKEFRIFKEKEHLKINDKMNSSNCNTPNQGTVMCVECEDQPAYYSCFNCQDDCQVCFLSQHKNGKRKLHKKRKYMIIMIKKMKKKKKNL